MDFQINRTRKERWGGVRGVSRMSSGCGSRGGDREEGKNKTLIPFQRESNKNMVKMKHV